MPDIWPGLITAADLTVIDHLGIGCQYITEDDVSSDIVGVFDAQYQREDAGNPGIMSSTPMLFVRLADLPVDPEADQGHVVVNGVEYRVIEPEKDGQGGCRLILHNTKYL
ncbi:hypothetical protein HW532_15675 [Kaustia mangrovi]|uniref:Uncharacterized protein n=1 Tax=Kaustia mangrovi TaxID=2593653 RepID=A0A7S8C609_9HYPH|nr:hypothetical protein [Kaustia mangrovi]QPC44002.1 hypothetical protein HW532_15675 [Kaustia mangrovi]